MRKCIFCLVLLLLSGSATSLSQGKYAVDTLDSSGLKQKKMIGVILPAGYDTTKQYPLLVLLHWFGATYGSWVEGNLMKNAEPYPMIIVMPDADRSWYVNSATDTSARYEDYIIQELIPFVQQKYSVDTTRRAIAGASMGGYGALVLAMRNPGTFLFAGDISGTLEIPRDLVLLGRKNPELRISALNAFGPERGSFRSSHDPIALCRTSAARQLTYFYLAVGVQDELDTRIATHRELADSLRANGASYEYRETQGHHTFTYFDAEIPPMFGRMWEVLHQGFRSVADVMTTTIPMGGVESAVQLYHELPKNYPHIYYTSEEELDRLGHRLLDQAEVAGAISLFKLNLESNPTSPKAFISLGEAYLKGGDQGLAAKNFEKALELDSKNIRASELLKQLKQE